jgi:hypothetical protein
MSAELDLGVSLHPIRLGDRRQTAPGWLIVAQGAVRGILSSGPDGQVLHGCACDRRILPTGGLMRFEDLEAAQAWLEERLPSEVPQAHSGAPWRASEEDVRPTALTRAADGAHPRRRRASALGGRRGLLLEHSSSERSRPRAFASPVERLRRLSPGERREREGHSMSGKKRRARPAASVKPKAHARIARWGIVLLKEQDTPSTMHIIGYIEDHDRLFESAGQPCQPVGGAKPTASVSRPDDRCRPRRASGARRSARGRPYSAVGRSS